MAIYYFVIIIIIILKAQSRLDVVDKSIYYFFKSYSDWSKTAKLCSSWMCHFAECQ